MPTYDYECDACKHKFEEFQSMKDEPLKVCPKCKKKKLRRLFGTGAAILFKGSGFYETDYRSASYQASAKADQEASKKASESNGSTNGTGGTDKKAPESGGKSSKSKD
jgi:putative FmdB family regulatory protein